jgi:uncharacterized C2H2 Zn-finger protein
VKVLAEEFKCKACGMTFKTKEELQEHAKKEHAS